MNDYDFTFRSVTAAMQGGQLLRQNGVPAATVRTPMELRQQGCGYSLRVGERVYRRAKELLDRANTPYRRLYRRQDGQWQEVQS